MEYFNFHFSIYNFIELVAVIINLALAVMILRMGAGVPANKWFATFLLCLAVWGAAQSLSMSSINPEHSVIWTQLGPPGWIFMSLAFFCFTLYFVGKEKLLDNFYIQGLFFIPGFLFLYLAWDTNLLVDMHDPSRQVLKPWGWDSEYGKFFWVFIVWLEFFFVVSMFLLFRYFLQLKNTAKKKQTFFVMFGLFIPLVIGSATDAILPILGIMFVKTAVMFTTVTAIIVAYAIFRYKLFLVPSSVAFFSIIDTMTESLIVLSPALYITQVNRGALSLLGYEEKELIGEYIQKLIEPGNTWKTFEERGIQPLHKGRQIRNLETTFLTKEGRPVSINFSASPIKEAGQEIIGIVTVATDITQTKSLIRKLEQTAEELKISKYELEKKLARITEAR